MSHLHATRPPHEPARIILDRWIRIIAFVAIGTLGTWCFYECVLPVQDSSQTTLCIVVAALLSLLLALALVSLTDYFNHTLKSRLDAERHLGVPVLGTVQKRGRRLIVPL